ncbi:WecB/TagA/CpsF family glycosyltransferase [Aestuariibaculum sp. M13]|uniref:WecB/TagA/CpsF family glycosyltransferase n=1 Tax=Aestuariibaculum sp. M13 TaxID=2967132 RepID=UPI002159DEA7|nr:WecB/TagA/CpsF family glycosyltransferase [Aestuariibaculum sp. M13]MCR8667199.1 WecB/TagA/CpsF family glycosyltransferase [Aestuariibaculum sp. M13]
MNSVDVLNIKIDSINCDDLLVNMKDGIVFTPNLDHLVKLQKDKEFYEAYKKADWVLCDSRIIFFYSKILDKKIKQTISGSSFFPKFYNYHKDNKNMKIFLLGAAEGVAEIAKNKINDKLKRSIIIETYSPPYGFESDEQECNKIIKIINASKANVLVVGLGAPKQEKWIVKYKGKLPGVELFMALGATIDFEAGNVKRAPVFFQTFGLEWLYRLVKEPRRLWKRYLIDDLPFFYLILKQKFGFYKNPFEKL